MAAFFLSSSVSLMILSPPLIVRSFRIRKFSSNRLRRSRSFSRPSIRSLVSAFLLVFLYKSNLNDSKLNTVLKLQLNDLKSRENELWRELFNLPVFSSANTAFSVAQAQKREDLIFGNLRCLLLLLIFLVIGLAMFSLFLHLIAAILFKYLEATTITLAIFFDKDSLLVVSLFVQGASASFVSPARITLWIVVMLSIVNGSHRLPSQAQSRQIHYKQQTKLLALLPMVVRQNIYLPW